VAAKVAKLLPGSARLIAPVPADAVVVPAAVMVPAVCVIGRVGRVERQVAQRGDVVADRHAAGAAAERDVRAAQRAEAS
jgi:hypothetical protein